MNNELWWSVINKVNGERRKESGRKQEHKQDAEKFTEKFYLLLHPPGLCSRRQICLVLPS
jgi:hypothetical protein